MKRRRWNEQQLRTAVAQARSLRQVIQQLGLVEAGGNYTQIKKYLREYGIETSFSGKGWRKGKIGSGKVLKSLEEILIPESDFQSFKLKKRLFLEKLKSPICELCGWAGKTKEGRIPVELDHINGNKRDNRIENLRILCPNCHSLQPTHRGLNIKKKG